MIAADVRGALQLRTNYFLINYAQKGNAFVTFLGIRLVIAPYSCAKKEGRKEGGGNCCSQTHATSHFLYVLGIIRTLVQSGLSLPSFLPSTPRSPLCFPASTDRVSPNLKSNLWLWPIYRLQNNLLPLNIQLCIMCPAQAND
jgi:hypothetical protein